MNIIQTTGGWLAKEKDYKTFIYTNTGTIRHIVRENNKITEVYTLTLKKDNFFLTKWNNITLDKTNNIAYIYPLGNKHLVWGIRTLRNQPFEEKEYYDIHEELFGIPNLLGDIECNSQLVQTLYRNPGIENLSLLLFGKIEKFLIEDDSLLCLSDLEGIYKCPWENKAEIIKKTGIDNGKYMSLFKCPIQFTKNINKINNVLIWEYWVEKFNKIPKKLKNHEEINHYLETKLHKNIPKSFQKIHSLLGDPVKEKSNLGFRDIQIKTDNLKIKIDHISPFPILHSNDETTPETEILICEELGIRSKKYIPSRLKRYEL